MRRLPLIPMFILAVFVVTGIFAPWIAPHNPERGIFGSEMYHLFGWGTTPR